MPKPAPKRKPGVKPKPRTKAERALQDLDRESAPARRRVSAKDRAFVSRFAEEGFKDANRVAKEAGFLEPYHGEKLVVRLKHLIDAERLRQSIGEQMELDEALRGVAELARGALDARVQLSAYRTVLEFHGALGSKSLPPDSRRTLARQVAELVDKLQASMKGKAGAKARVRAILTADARGKSSAAVEAEVSGEADDAIEASAQAPAPALPAPDPASD